MNNESAFLRSTRLTENDISYRQFDIKGGKILLTDEGNRLLHDGEIRKRLREYIEEIGQPKAHPDASSRIYLREGGNAHVYLVGDLPLAVKEMSNSRSSAPALKRIEALRRASKNFPPYIKVPIHYGVLWSDSLGKEYILMEKINDGLNVMDIIEQPSHFGQAGTLAVETYYQAKDEVEKALTEQGQDPALLDDWKEENVLVDFSLASPPLPFTLWIIDQ